MAGTGKRKKLSGEARKAVQRTQPKMARHIDFANGTDRMVVVEPSEVEKERTAAAKNASQE